MSVQPRLRSLGYATMAALVLAIALVCVSITACGTAIITPSGQVETQTREIASFDRVALEGAGTLTIVPGTTAGLTIRADKNLMPYITAEVVNSELRLGIDARGRILKVGSGTLEYQLTAPSIVAVSNSGSGKVTGGPFSGGGLFTIVDSGSGTVELTDVSVISLSSTVSGSGAVKIDKGVTGALEINVSGSGSFKAPNLESKVATVKVSGSGDVEVWATEGLDALVSGSGDISYWGSPQVTSEVSGSGRVKSLGTKSSSGG